MRSKKYEKEVEENERAFQEAMSQWVTTGDKQYWDTMFFCIHKACLYMAKSKCYGIVARDLNDKVMDAVLDIMNRIKNDGVRPEKLSSFCYLYTIGKLWSKKEIRWDRAPDTSLVLNNATYCMDINDENEVVTTVLEYSDYQDNDEYNMEINDKDKADNVESYLNVGKYSYDFDEDGKLITNILDNIGEDEIDE